MSQNYTIAEVAEKVRVSERTILREIKRGKLETNKAGRRYLITESQLNDYLGKGEPEISLAIDTYLHSKKAEMVAMLQQLIALSESDIFRLLEYLRAKLTTWGFRVKVDETHMSLRVSFGYGNNNILFRAPLDVVPAGNERNWSHHPFEGVVMNGRLFGRGSYDGKSGIVSVLYALRALKKYVSEDVVGIEILFDTGSVSNSEQFEDTINDRVHASEGICCIGNKGTIGKGSYGSWTTKVSVSGRLSEDNSENPIVLLASFIDSQKNSTGSDKLSSYPETVEVIQIEGGTGNISPDYCEAHFAISTKPGKSIKDAQKVFDNAFSKDLHGISKGEIIGYSGYVVDENLAVIKNLLVSLETKVGMKPACNIRLKGFGGEVYYKHGISLVYFGPDGGNSCSCDEFVEIDSLPQTSAVYADVVLRHFEVL